MEKGAWNFYALPGDITLQEPPHIPLSRSSQTLSFGVLWRLHYIGMLANILGEEIQQDLSIQILQYFFLPSVGQDHPGKRRVL
jgi:hypothetical protein